MAKLHRRHKRGVSLIVFDGYELGIEFESVIVLITT